KMIEKVMAAARSPILTVSALTVEVQKWQPKLDAAGSLRAVKGVDISTEVSGIIDAINFESSTEVKAEDVLVLLRAEEDVARLRALEATAKLAQVTYDRDKKQLDVQAVSQAVVDTDAANLAASKAQAAAQKALVDKKIIYAPFSGHIGIKSVDVGQYVTPGTVIATLQQLDPIYVDFFVSEQDFPRVKTGQKVAVKIDANPNMDFVGEIVAVNPKVDDATRNVQVRGKLKNPDRLMLPGMFAKVTVDTGTLEDVMTLPQTAIVYNPYGNTVYVVEENASATDPERKLTSRQTFVVTGRERGDQVEVISGIKAGDRVVTSGQMKLRNGSFIKINNDVSPSNDPDPKPEDDEK
ncbi:MAG: efflux RND transporter periplasmic adaptor subunit, partial [Alphaproteobacteria bacterium]|nr:efflux RND transporter periplasmic adaptor subunit [Alphaproteobacteria bacterium]